SKPRNATRPASPDLTHQPADPQAELVADFDDFTQRHSPIAHIKLQRLIARFIEFHDRTRAKFRNLLDRLALRCERDLNWHPDLEKRPGVRRHAAQLGVDP